MNFDKELDARGLSCPLPILKTKKTLNDFASGQVLKIPVAHADGNYYTDPVTLAAMQANAQIVLRYCTPEGKATPEANPNGSLDNIAGIINAEGNVLGMMPHPERCAEAVLGNDDGKQIFLSMLESLKGNKKQLKMVEARGGHGQTLLCLRGHTFRVRQE